MSTPSPINTGISPSSTATTTTNYQKYTRLIDQYTNMSLRIVPADTKPSKLTTTTPSSGAPSVPIVHDTLRAGLAATSSQLNSHHPLESRLKNWETTQDELKMEGLRRTYGASEPMRRGMEKLIAGSDFRPLALGGPSNFHLDILNNRDCSIDWEDVFVGEETLEAPDFHTEMEGIMRTKY